MKRIIRLSCLLMLFGVLSCNSEKPNILFIAVDDLRPELACYGKQHITSPNIDRLASKGLVFENAYCNVPVCGASRASLLTGIRPTKSRFLDYNTYAKNDVPDAMSLPEYFKNNGYQTISNGKVFHHIDDIPESWSEKAWSPAAEAGNYLNYQSKENIHIQDSTGKRAYPFEMTDVNDDAYFDGQIASKTINDLKRLKETGKPFFLAAGFLKPHLPFNAPKKYWDLYSPDRISLPDNYFPPENVPIAAMHNFGELRSYYGIPKRGAVPDEMALEMIHGYYACVSYVDAQIGRLLDALDELGLAGNTIVILWGDHGWQLGEHSLWCKHANFKTSLNAPLIISAPGFQGNKKTKALVEFVDIFPSLCELTGFEEPGQLQGTSFVPLMKNPNLKWKDAVFSRFIRGESVITNRYIYSEWFGNNGNPMGNMLYDHYTDPDENVNIVESPELKDSVSIFKAKLEKYKSEVVQY